MIILTGIVIVIWPTASGNYHFVHHSFLFSLKLTFR